MEEEEKEKKDIEQEKAKIKEIILPVLTRKLKMERGIIVKTNTEYKGETPDALLVVKNTVVGVVMVETEDSLDTIPDKAKRLLKISSSIYFLIPKWAEKRARETLLNSLGLGLAGKVRLSPYDITFSNI